MPPDIVRDLGYLTLGTRMRRIGELLQAETQAIMQDYDVPVPPNQHPFLAALDRIGPMTVGELAQAIGITQPGATRTIGNLVEAGLVETSMVDDDQRRRQVSLTDAGRSFVTFCKATLWPVIDSAVRDLCSALDGPLLDQLAGVEERLARSSLLQRISDKPETDK